MAYNTLLADRMTQCLRDLGAKFYEKKMFGGLTFMVDDKMCVGVLKDELMVRIDPEKVDEALNSPGCRIMDFTGKPMKGYLIISGEGYDMDEDLEYWIALALEFNPKAKSSKKKK